MAFDDMPESDEKEPDTSFAGTMPITSPSSGTFSGAQLGNAFEKMGQAYKAAAAGFSKLASAEKLQVISSPTLSALDKLALVKFSSLSPIAKHGLGLAIYGTMPSAQKQALFGATMGAVSGGKALAKKDNISKSLDKATGKQGFKRQYGDVGRSVQAKQVGK
jgi:hypothetical protein